MTVTAASAPSPAARRTSSRFRAGIATASVIAGRSPSVESTTADTALLTGSYASSGRGRSSAATSSAGGAPAHRPARPWTTTAPRTLAATERRTAARQTATRPDLEDLVTGPCCDVCGELDHVHELTPTDRDRWPGVARLVQRACARCLRRFATNAERWKWVSRLSPRGISMVPGDLSTGSYGRGNRPSMALSPVTAADSPLYTSPSRSRHSCSPSIVPAPSRSLRRRRAG